MLKTLLRLIALLFVAGGLLGAFLLKPALIGVQKVGLPGTLTITSSSTAKSIAHDLQAQGIIEWSWGYELYAFFDRQVNFAKPGRYQLVAGSAYRSIARQLAQGPVRSESQVTLIEGWDVDEITNYLAQEKRIDPQATKALIGASVNRAPFEASLRDEYLFLKDLPQNRSLEGYLFPNTYRVWDDELPEGLIRKQLAEFERRFGSEEPTQASAPLKDLDEVVILASIIEKEVPHAEDRKRIAGIFLNRLRIGMALQTDASLSYLTGSSRAQATQADLAIDSPFNTYKYRGLPPAPISNPGATAIEAVLNPEENDYLYFLTDKEGNIYYAKTLEEHARNRQKAGL